MSKAKSILVNVQSTSIKYVSWTYNQALIVCFNTDTKYIYANVSIEDLWDMVMAESFGKAFIDKIKDNPTDYPFEVLP